MGWIGDASPAIVAAGDLLRDIHVLSSVTRLNPESPNVVIEAGPSTETAGGVGIGCRTLINLGVDVTLASAWGIEDQDMVQFGKTCEGINLIPGSSVPHKTRYVADRTVLARVDSQAHNGTGSSGASCGRIEDFVVACDRAEAVLASDYGLDLALAIPDVYRTIARIAGAGVVVWDFHPRSKVVAPPGALVKFNQSDFLQLASRVIAAEATLEEVATQLLALYDWRAVLVTEGAAGALLVTRNGTERLPTYPVRIGSAVGAGDILSALWARFAVDSGISESAARAVRVASIALAARESALHDVPRDVLDEDLALAIKAVGGRLVVTAGCFDLLHTGHIDLLRAARRLGDALVVLVNSDSSVSRIKGSPRPFLPIDDRVSVLRELRCVNAVGTFNEDTPEEGLLRLRPDVYVKGGDYTLRDLPEATTLVENGTEVRIVPRIRDISTTSIAEGLLG